MFCYGWGATGVPYCILTINNHIYLFETIMISGYWYIREAELMVCEKYKGLQKPFQNAKGQASDHMI